MLQQNKTGYIYKITNLINGKAYIGMTINNINSRWAQHKSDSKKNSQCPIHRAIRKYGYTNFSIEILETTNIDIMGASEIKFISLFKTTDSSLGYNSSTGGESGKIGVKSWNSGKTKEYCASLKSIADKQMGKNNSFYGKTHSTELKRKWSQERLGRKLKPRPEMINKNTSRIWTQEAKDKISKANSKQILCLTNNKIYPSITKMCQELNLDRKSVYNVLNGKFKQTKGYSFVYNQGVK